MEIDPMPKLTAGPGAYIVSWPLGDKDLIRFSAKRIHQHSDGRLTGIVSITVGSNSHETTLAHSQLNLASSQARRGIARTLDERYPLETDVGWDQIIETSCRLVMEREEQGEPVCEIEPVENVEVEYLLWPLLIEHLPTVIYAPGGQGKSLVSMYIALLLQNGLGLDGEPGKQANVLYLDYESDKTEAARRATLLARGIKRAYSVSELKYPYYRRCALPLKDEVSELAAIVAKHNIGLVIVDSLGVAAGGDLNAAEVILSFFAGLREVCKATSAASLPLGHTSKEDRRNENAPRLPIGSVYTENCARLMFELRADDEEPGEITCSLLPRKANLGKPDPLGLCFLFGTEAILVKQAEPVEVLSDKQTASEAILDVLSTGPASISEIIQRTELSSNTVRTTLARMKRRGLVFPTQRGCYELSDKGKDLC